MICPERIFAGPKSSFGVVWRTVPYEIATERICDSADDIAAPMVPEDMAKAAGNHDLFMECSNITKRKHRPEEFLPRFGPEILHTYQFKLEFESYHKEQLKVLTTRSIVPG